jgi:hypothetical protein
MILQAAEYLDDETVLRKLPFLTEDEIEGILQRKGKEEIDRYARLEKENEELKAQQNGVVVEQPFEETEIVEE